MTRPAMPARCAIRTTDEADEAQRLIWPRSIATPEDREVVQLLSTYPRDVAEAREIAELLNSFHRTSVDWLGRLAADERRARSSYRDGIGLAPGLYSPVSGIWTVELTDAGLAKPSDPPLRDPDDPDFVFHH
ncbi:MAG: hypothetical protein ACXWZ3_12855, partial [Solirubrobacterales bacterium]